MDSDRWKRIKEIFDEAYDLPTGERMAFVERACSDDETLVAEIMKLFGAEDSVHSMLDGVAMDAAGVLDEVSKAGRRVGPYILKEQLGIGGMGEVYLAERADGEFEHEVALKLVRGGAGGQSGQIQARFRSERQILARLQHPNIARLLDGGLSEDGQPFFVLEYVDGRPIDEYANEEGLGVEARLRLFDQVCRAVTYAHANLVVHRDLKPSNIMVRDDGVVKLLDFGIAKVLSEEGDAGGSPPLTRTGGAVMTPAYASPEQARGEAVNTSTDIYSLGVVLYELLSGLRPYQVDSGNPLEAARVICEVEPERPSTAVTRADQAASMHSTHGSDTSRLRRLLSGDLDVICLKALRKEPARRYTTADELGEDIRRHLDGRPIEARAESASYRAGKFVRRHRVGVGLTVAIVAATVIGTSVYTAKLQAARDDAEGMTAFVVDMLKSTDPYKKGSDLRVVDVLDEASKTVDERYADNPVLRARIHYTIGYAYYALEFYEKAVDHLSQALAIRERVLGMTAYDTRLARNDLVGTLGDMGRKAEADSLLEILLANQPADHLDDMVVAARAEKAHTLWLDGRMDEAETLYREVIPEALEVGGPASRQTTDAEIFLGVVLSDMGRFDEAESLYVHVLNVREEAGTPLSWMLTPRFELALLYAMTGQDSLAIEEHLRLIDNYLEVSGERNANLQAARSNLALLYLQNGRYVEAQAEAKKALEGSLKIVDPKAPTVAYNYITYGMTLAKTDLEAARPNFEHGIVLADEIWPDGVFTQGDFRKSYAEALAENGHTEEALAIAREAAAIYEKTPNPSEDEMAEFRELLARLEQEVRAR